MPSIAVDCGFVIGIIGAVLDSYVLGICTRSVVGIGVVVCKFPRGIILKTMPKVALAGGLRIYVVCTVIDSQV